MMFKNKITVFTATFNRAYTLPELYESLIKQTSKDFIWLIVDDGSTDNTEKLIDGWINENTIEIEYHKQSNKGKSMTHNKGVSLTKTELFTSVDSDDYLDKHAIEEILEIWRKNNEKSNIIGVLAYKGNVENHSKVQSIHSDIVSTTLRDAYRKHGLVGDTFLIFRTDIISKYALPDFEGEKYVPENFLYDLIDQNGELIVLNKTLYYYKYLDDGFTNDMARFLFNNPQGYIAYIKQRLNFDDKLKDKILDSIRYIAMCISAEEKVDFKVINPLIILFCYPMGYVLYLKKFKKFKKLQVINSMSNK